MNTPGRGMTSISGEGAPVTLVSPATRALLAQALAEPALWIGAALLLLTLGITVASRLGAEIALDPVSEGLDGALIATVVLAFVRRPRHTEDRGRRAFRVLLALGFSVWAIVEMITGFGPSGVLSPWLSVAVETGFLISYFFFLLATFEGPEVPPSDGPAWLGHRFLRRTAVATTTLTLMVYLLVVPGVVASDLTTTAASSFLVYVLLDLIIAVRLWVGAFGAGSLSNRLGLALLAIAFSSWFASDLGTLVASNLGLKREAGGLVDLLWYLPFLPAIAAGTLRNDSAQQPAAERTEAEGAATHRPRVSSWPYYLIALIPLLVHFAGSAAGIFAPEAHRTLEVVIFIYVILVCALVLIDAVLQSSRARWARQRAHQMQLEALGRLAGGVAHEFNNLLQIIVGYAEILRHRAISRGSDELETAYILDASERAASLTRQLLVFARRLDDHPERVDLRAKLTEIHAVLRRLIPEDIEMVLAFTGRDLAVQISPGQLDQIVTNLVLNARDAVSVPGGRISIQLDRPGIDGLSAAAEIPPGDWVRITVEDNGEGMTPSTARRAFEPFFTTKQVGAGTGLGLSVVWGIAREAGGRAHLTPGREGGTRVEVYLPLAPDSAAPSVPAAESLDSVEPHRARLLLVEDDRGVAESLADSLREAGYSVVTAFDAATGEALLADPSIELLLTDIVLPDDSGLDLAERAAELRPELPVIFISGYPDSVLTERGLQPGVDWLQKPADLHQLIARIEKELPRVHA